MALAKYRKLHGRTIEKLGAYSKLADALGMSRQNLSNKIAGITSFSVTDIKNICRILEIPKEDIHKYFFVD